MTAKPFLHRAGLANSRWFGPHLFSFLATGSETDGLFALMEVQLLAGHEPPPHTQEVHDTAFYVLDGEVRHRIGTETARASEGDFALLPAGVEHGFRVLSGQARALLLTAPAGLEQAFRVLSEPASRLEILPDPRPLDPGRFLNEFGRRGVVFRCPTAPEPATSPNPGLVTRPVPDCARSYFGHIHTPLVTGAQTGGRFALSEVVVRRGHEPPPHPRYHEDEGYYVLEGDVTFHCDGRALAARPGEFVFLPRGLPRGYEIQSGAVRMLMLLTPPSNGIGYSPVFPRPRRDR
jgi:quercetin dioxygenase-like cupin family protein